MEFFVGTSGWAYDWNKQQNLSWFVKSSGLNAVELNMSFYRFPSQKAAKSWGEKGKDLHWAIKANRLFTHNHKFNEKAKEKWSNFHEVFAPLEGNIDFYLFQLPPQTTPDSVEQIGDFARLTNLKERFALEFRNKEWFTDQWAKWARDLGITLVSVDAPNLPGNMFSNNGLVYLRIHGKNRWYSHNYTDTELWDLAKKIADANPEKAYVFFNNNHNMLANAQAMLQTLKKQQP